MKGRSYTFERIESLENHFHKITLNRGSSCITSPDWINLKKSTINPKNTKDNMCFLFSRVATLNYENIADNPQRITNLKLFIVNYNWDDKTFQQDIKIILHLRKIIAILQ